MQAARAAGVPVWSEVELGFRLLPDGRAAGRHHGHQRQDDRHRAGRRDAARRAPPRSWPATWACALSGIAGDVPADGDRRVRAVVVPARGRRDAALRRGGADQPDARPPRPARHDGGVRPRQAAHLRAAARRRHRGAERRRPVGGGARRRCRATARRGAHARRRGRRRSASAGRACAARTTARTSPSPRRWRARWARRTTRSRGAVAAFRPVPHRLEHVGDIGGVSLWNDSKATNVDATLKALTAFPGRRAAHHPRRLRQGRRLRAAGRRRWPAPCRAAYLIGPAGRRMAPLVDAVVAGRGVRHAGAGARRRAARRAAGRGDPARAGVRVVRRVHELRGARRPLPRARRGPRRRRSGLTAPAPARGRGPALLRGISIRGRTNQRRRGRADRGDPRPRAAATCPVEGQLLLLSRSG